MPNYQHQTLPFRVGDRVSIPFGEVGTIKSVDRNSLRVLLADDELISVSAFDVSLVAHTLEIPNRCDWRPQRPR